MKAVLFDLDGTVVNTLPDLWNITNITLKEYGYPTHTMEEVRFMVGRGMRVLLTKALPENVPLSEEIFSSLKANYLQYQNTLSEVYPGITEMLRKLHARGVKTAIVTNKPHEAALEVVKHYFGDLIDFTIGQRDGDKPKPDPKTCILAAEALSVPISACIYVGDSDVDVMTAKNAGIPCLSAAWGFRGAEFLLAHGSETVIDNPLDVLKYV